MKITYFTYHGNDMEDKFVVENFNLPERGTFVDVGAGPDGIQGSNTYFFEKNGWDGLAIDGDPRTFHQIKANRQNAIEAVVSVGTKEVSYFMNESTSDLSGLKNTPNNSDRSIKVQTVTLESILEANKISKIHLLSVDTEGSEVDVLKSLNFDIHKPQIVIVEFITQGTPNMEAGAYLKNAGYNFIARVGANLIFHD